MVRIQLLGHFDIRRDDEPIQIGSRPLKELLCYLLIHRQRNPSREVLASDLWGDRSTSQSLKTLRQALWQLKKLVEGVRELSFHDREFPQLELDSSVEMDISLLDHAASLLDLQAIQTAERISCLRRAAAAYRGDLLEDWHHEWCLIERERYRSLYLAVLDALISVSIANREVQAGLRYAHQALELEPARECTHRDLMELFLVQGDRTAALHQFERCARLLGDTYGVEPSASTLAVYRQAREPGDVTTPRPAEPSDLGSMFRQILELLRDIKRVLES